MEKELTFQVKINTGDLFHFFMYHAYSRFSGIFSIVFGLAMFVLMAYTYGSVPIGQSILYGLFGLFFLIFNPINFYMKAYSQIKNSKAFHDPIIYTFHEEGVTTKQKEESATIPWGNIQKIVTTKRCIILYVTKVRANIIPKNVVGNDYDQLIQVIKKSMEPVKVRIK